MTLVTLLKRKEQWERCIVYRIIHLIDSMPRYTIRQALVFTFALGLAFFFLSVAFQPYTTDALYTLVEPGSYRPRQCAQWKFEDNTHEHLEQTLKLLSETVTVLNISVLTGNQMSIPFCVIQLQDVSLLNPKLISTSGSHTQYTIKLNSLCGPQNTSRYSAKLGSRMALSWTDAVTRKLMNQHFEGQLAYELQVALLVLKGENICQRAL